MTGKIAIISSNPKKWREKVRKFTHNITEFGNIKDRLPPSLPAFGGHRRERGDFSCIST